jgi:hypothetical protein
MCTSDWLPLAGLRSARRAERALNAQAARKLGWPGGSISYRLARGREMLRERLNAQA